MPHPIPVETPVTTTLCSPVMYPAPHPSDRRLEEVPFCISSWGTIFAPERIFPLSHGRAPRLSTHSNTKLAAHHAERMSTLGLRAAFLIVSAIWLDRIVSPMFHPTEMICCDLEARLAPPTSLAPFATRMSPAFSPLPLPPAF